MSAPTTVSILAEIPEDLHELMRAYLELHPEWTHDRLITGSLALFLAQNGSAKDGAIALRKAGRIYLDTLFTSLQNVPAKPTEPNQGSATQRL